MTEIGKVSVRVMPDTRGFASKAKRDLKRLKDLSFKVDVELNERQFNAQVKRLIAKTNSDLHSPENHIKFRASLEASNRQLSSEVRDVRRRMQAMANEEKIEFHAELSKKLGKGEGGLLKLDPKGAVKELKRELGGTRYEIPVFANTSGAMKDIRRMSRSSRFKIDVDLMVDRKKVHKDIDSISKLFKTATDALKRTDALKFQIDVDKASVKKWTESVKEVEASLKEQRKVYQDTQRELQIVKDRAAAYGETVGEATKAVTKLKAQQKADVEREQELTKELLEVRRVIASSAGDVTEETIREKRLVGQIEKMRREAFERSAKRAEAEAKAMQEIRDASREIQKLEEKRAKLKAEGIASAGQIEKLEVDHKKLQKELDRARNKLEMDAIELDVNLDQASVEAVAARLAVLARDRVVTIFTRIQKNSLNRFEKQLGNISQHSKDLGNNVVKWIGQLAGVRVLWRTFRDMVDWLPRLDMMVPQLAQNFSLLTAAVTSAVGALGMAFTLLSDIGEVGKLALVAPAGVAALGLQIWMLARAYNDYIKHVPEVAKDLDDLSGAVSDGVWSTATDNIKALHKALMPLLDLHMPAWAKELGNNVGGMADGFRKATKAGAVDQFFKNAIKGSKNATRGFEALGSALLRLAGAGSTVFPDLATWFSDAMGDFDKWVTRNAGNGNIERWIREGATALRELGSIAVSTVKIIAGVADAFDKAGWPGLTELEAGMRSLAESALALKDSDAFMQPLEQIRYFFESFDGLQLKFEMALKNLWGMVGDSAENLAGPISRAVAYMLDGFNSAKFQSGFGKFVTGIASFVDDIGPGLGAMTAEIGSLLGVVGTAAKSWGPAFNDMLLLFSSAGDKLHPGLLDFVENMGPRLEELVTNITPHVEDFSEALGNLLGNENFQQLVGDLINDLGDLGGMILDLGTWVVETAEKFSDWYGGLSDGQQDFVRWTGLILGFGAGALGVLGGALIKITGFFRALGGALKFLKLDKLLAPLKNLKLGALLRNVADDIALRAMYFWDKVKGLGKLLGSAVRSIGTGIGKAASGAWSALKGVGTKLGGVLRSLVDDVALRAMYLVDGLKGLGTKLGNAFKGLVGKIKLPTLKGLAGGIGKLLAPIVDFVKKIPGQLAKILPKGGLLKLVGKALTRFIPVVGWILLARDILNLIKPVPVLEWVEGILRGLGLDNFANIIADIKDNIAKIFGEDVGLIDLFNPLTNALRKAWDGMVEGWKSGGFWGAVEGFFSGFADGFSDSFQLLWANLKSGLQRGITWLQEQVKGWNPTSGAGQFAKDLVERLPGLLGMNEDGSFSWDTLISSWKEFGSDLWSSYIWPWLQESWSSLVGWARQWRPLDEAIGFFQDPWGKIKEWLHIDDLLNGNINVGTLVQWGVRLWNDKIEPWLRESWDGLVSWARQWGPIDTVVSFFEDPWGKIKEWLGIEDLVSGGIPTIGELVHWGTNLWNEKIKPWLVSSWNALLNWARQWEPLDKVIDFFEDPWGKIQEWLGIDDWTDGELPSLGELAEWGTDLWNEDIKPWLQSSWDKLTNLIQNWTPIGWVFKFGTWVGDKIKEWLGIDEDGVDFGDFSIDFDFSDVWENKIKPALKNGLIALGALIAAPGLILVAPLAMPALIIGWLLGRDEEGNWSFQELTSKIEGAWNKIKEAITTGVETIIGLVGGIVITPIAIGTKMADWILGSDWIEEAKKGITGAIENAGPALQGAVEKGVETVERGINGGQKAGAKAGGALRRVLGIDDKGKGQIDLDFNTVGEWVQRFGGKARDEYGTTADSTSGSMDKMRNSTKSRFSDMAKHALAKAGGMRSGVGSDFSSMSGDAATKAAKMQAVVAQKMSLMQTKATVQSAKMQASVVQKMGLMQTQAGVKMVAMQKAIVQAMTQANVMGVRQAGVMSTAYIAAMTRLLSGAIRIASQLRGTLPRLLTINATGSGRSTGNTFVSGLSSGLSRAVGVARSMASRIRNVLRINVYSSGSSVGSTFASGIRSRIGSVSSAASALARAARAKMPNSPADEGPFSGSGWGGWGESIAEELAKGLRKSAPEVAREAEKLMGGVHSALDARSNATVGIDFERTRRRYGLASDSEEQATGTTVNVNVESRSEDPLRDGNRFGGDIAFALRGAGLA